MPLGIADAVLRAVVLGAVGALMLLGAYGFAKRRGISQYGLERWYHHQYRLLSTPWKNGPLVMIPAGLLCVIGSIGYLLVPLVPDVKTLDRSATAILVAVVTLVGLVGLLGAMFGLFAISIAAMFRPPRWLKPTWLLEEEKRLSQGLPSLVPLPPEGDRPVTTQFGVRLLWIAAIVVPLGVFSLGWPPALLLGLSFALSWLAAARIRPSKSHPPDD